MPLKEAKWVSVSISSTTGSNISPGGGNMPISTFRDTNNNQEFTIYPNPAKNKLNIISSLSNTTSLILYNLNGKEVLRKTISSSKETLDVSKLPNGMYFIQVIGEISAVRKIIIDN